MDYDNDYQESYVEDDLYMYNQNEADDYRNEGRKPECDTCGDEGIEGGCPECGEYPYQDYTPDQQEDFGYFGYMGMMED